MDQLAFRTIFILLQAAVGVFVFYNEVWQRLGAGRGGFRPPQRRHLGAFIVDWLFWLGVAGWVIVGVSWFFFPWTRTYFLPLNTPPLALLQWPGLLTAAAALYFIAAGIVSLGSSFRTSIDHDETPILVTHGIYRHIRNPMALGLLLHGWAGFLLHQSWIALAAAVILHSTNRLRVHFEESYLRNNLGKPYEEYCRRAGRFFPKKIS